MSKHASTLHDRIRRILPAVDAPEDVGAPTGAEFALAEPPRRRWSRRTARGVVLCLAALLGIVGWWWWQGRPREVTPPPVAVATGAPVMGASQSPPASALVVHVVGDVRNPGLVRLPEGARVDDAVAAAGGVRPGARLGAVNLAREVVDGEQIVIGRHARAAGASAPGLLDLNSAAVGDFESLPGIGPVLAARIVAWRDANGRFTAVEELREVSGIGDSTYADLAPLVRV